MHCLNKTQHYLPLTFKTAVSIRLKKLSLGKWLIKEFVLFLFTCSLFNIPVIVFYKNKRMHFFSLHYESG